MEEEEVRETKMRFPPMQVGDPSSRDGWASPGDDNYPLKEEYREWVRKKSSERGNGGWNGDPTGCLVALIAGVIGIPSLVGVGCGVYEIVRNYV